MVVTWCILVIVMIQPVHCACLRSRKTISNISKMHQNDSLYEDTYATVWRETLTVGKFGKFVEKLKFVEENLANLLILRLKLIQQNSRVHH